MNNEIYESCNTTILDVTNLTIIESLPESEDVGAMLHLSRLSIYATPDRPDYNGASGNTLQETVTQLYADNLDILGDILSDYL